MRNINWDNVQEASDFPKVTPGGYLARIVAVKDEEDKEYLLISYDFAEGELKGYYKDLAASKGFWGGTFVRSYKEKALPFFKAFKTAVEESNPGYVFQNDPQSLVGKWIGVIIGEEEYWSDRDRKVKIRTYVDQVRSGQAIRAGDFEVPLLKKYEGASVRAAFYQEPTFMAPSAAAAGDPFGVPLPTDDDLPFDMDASGKPLPF